MVQCSALSIRGLRPRHLTISLPSIHTIAYCVLRRLQQPPLCCKFEKDKNFGILVDLPLLHFTN